MASPFLLLGVCRTLQIASKGIAEILFCALELPGLPLLQSTNAQA